MQVLIEEECMRKRVVWAPKELVMESMHPYGRVAVTRRYRIFAVLAQPLALFTSQ